MSILLISEWYIPTETLRGAIHRWRHLTTHHNTISCEKTVKKEVQNVLTQNLDLDITELLGMREFLWVPKILKIVTDKNNYNALSLSTLKNIIFHLEVAWNIPKDAQKLKKVINEIFEAKRKIPGVK